MKNFFVLLITFLLLQLNTVAQAPDTLWTKVLSEGTAVQVLQTNDKGFMILGCQDYFKIFLIKTNNLGDTVWTRIIDGFNQRAHSMKKTMSGDYMIFATGNFHYLSWPLLIKINSIGDTLWVKTLPGDTWETTGGMQTDDGGYILSIYDTGVGELSNNQNLYGSLIKTDSNGELLWQKYYEAEKTSSVIQLEDGGYIFTGIVSSSTNVYLMRTDSIGNSVWSKTYNFYSDYSKENKLCHTLDGGFLIMFNGSNDIGLIKTDSSGNFIWSKSYGYFGDECGNSLQSTSDGNYIIAGYTTSFGNGDKDFWIIKINNAGDTLWTKYFGSTNDDIGKSIIQNINGEYTLVGETHLTGSPSILLARLASDSLTVINSDVISYDFELEQNYPNPFNPSTKIKYSVPQSSNVIIRIYDILGNEIETLVNEEKQTGTYEITWYAESLLSGVYFYQLKAGDFIQTKKMVLMK
jgi:hypothetical protein